MIRTHWLAFTKNAKDQERLQAEEDNNEDQRYELVECVEGISLVLPSQSVIPVAGPAETSVERNVACSNEDDDGGDQEQAD